MYYVDAYVDGACSGNPGPMGIGVLLIDKTTGKEKEYSQSLGGGTNNIAELMAAIMALRMCKNPKETEITIHTDSQLTYHIIRNEWNPKKNLDLVRELNLLKKQFAKVEAVKVKGHSTDEYNNRVDRLAVNSIKK